MSERDKKLLVYLGALVILAAAYFLVGKPFLDKIDALQTEKMQLDKTLQEKKKAAEKQDEYIQLIDENNKKVQDIMAKFPEDISDEKSIMFASKAEADIPVWFSQVKFAEEVKMMINGEEITVDSVEEAENQLADEAAAQEATFVEENGGQPVETSFINNLMWRRTDLGLTFQTKYDGFKNFLAYVRDYEDRMIIKDIDVTYDEFSGMVSGNMVISQYAILGEGRELPEVVTNVESIGTNNIFTNENKGGSILDLLASVAADFLNAIVGGTSTEVQDKVGTDYFIKLNASNDNSNGKTIGRADDVQGGTHVTSNNNSREDISFSVAGNMGDYMVKYTIGDKTYTDSISKSDDGKIYLRIISTERYSDDDKVAASIHINNNADIPVYVNVEGDDSTNPRVNIVERSGEVTVK